MDGDTCDAYVGNQHYCNAYDTSTFISARECCACGGGKQVRPYSSAEGSSVPDIVKYYTQTFSDGSSPQSSTPYEASEFEQ